MLALDLVTVALYSLFLGADLVTQFFRGLLPMLLLLEAGLIFLAGGLSVLSSTVFFTKVREYVFHSEEKWSMDKYRLSERGALPYMIVGVMLLGESMFLAYV